MLLIVFDKKYKCAGNERRACMYNTNSMNRDAEIYHAPCSMIMFIIIMLSFFVGYVGVVLHAVSESTKCKRYVM